VLCGRHRHRSSGFQGWISRGLRAAAGFATVLTIRPTVVFRIGPQFVNQRQVAPMKRRSKTEESRDSGKKSKNANFLLRGNVYFY
jgi:hypothetical protein